MDLIKRSKYITDRIFGFVFESGNLIFFTKRSYFLEVEQFKLMECSAKIKKEATNLIDTKLTPAIKTLETGVTDLKVTPTKTT